MSQAGSLLPGGGGGGGTDIVTITGNNAVAIAPNGAGNFNLIGTGGLIVTSVAAPANTLLINPGTNFILQTNDATPHTLITILTTTNSAGSYIATIVGARADYSASASSTFLISARDCAKVAKDDDGDDRGTFLCRHPEIPDLGFC